MKAGPEAGPFTRGSNQSGMRAYNERLVLSLVRRHGALAKAEIARLTGLSAQTVSVIMRALEADGLLVKGDPVRGRVGQPSIPMRLAPEGAFFFGLKLGRRSSEVILTNFLGREVGRRRHTYRYPTPDSIRDFTLEAVAELGAGLGRDGRARIAGLGIAMPFMIWDWAQAIGLAPGAMDAWRETDIRAELADALDLPVFLQNDATSACGAELVFGESGLTGDFLYFYVGYFIGGGIALNGALLVGRTGNAGALGSLPVPGPDGMRQLIDVASLQQIEARTEALGARADTMWRSPEGWDLPRGVLADWVAGAANGLAYAVAAASAVIDFETAMIDGWMPAALRADLVAQTRSALAGVNLAGLSAPRIIEGTVGPDARSLGAASLPLSERFLLDATAFMKQN
ncbi:ROK family transcriptional regulator [Roseivivax sp. CAU 1761]